jgi:alkylation response protein AidB-like acyl-CoA dehydrogenase
VTSFQDSFSGLNGRRPLSRPNDSRAEYLPGPCGSVAGGTDDAGSGMTSMMHRALLVLLVVALIAAGCGKASLAQQRFTTAAHALCKELTVVLESPGSHHAHQKKVLGRMRALIYANRSLPSVAKYLRDTDRVKALEARGTTSERLRNQRRAELRALGITSCLPLEK